MDDFARFDTRRDTVSVLGAPIDALDWPATLSRLAGWAQGREGRYVCICNAHSVVTSRRDPRFARVVNEADMATPDGAPVAWLMRRLGEKGQERINGPDLMWHYFRLAARRAEPIYLYGGSPETLELLVKKLGEEFPELPIAGHYSPPFRKLAEEEDAAVIRAINASGARTVWVGLGCPKQERWMAEHRDKIRAVLVGVGAAFDYHAGTVKRAPRWMQRSGFEWLHRLLNEPKRLWKRYLATNSLFLWYAACQLLRFTLRRTFNRDATPVPTSERH
ncbi:glycosyl transferase [Geomonas silvestris]|uniref:Glycosyl transferase n=1 Tax=Geomonas silvestris TaxID=2740184 RepID=A0A6V8MHJ3_9BACT|nr:WecB/TagA/CpsF family glycosyltransferase [Geomonas silvestris]GFO59394.1 glycosyl transferase [Geomonas silvestris]